MSGLAFSNMMTKGIASTGGLRAPAGAPGLVRAGAANLGLADAVEPGELGVGASVGTDSGDVRPGQLRPGIGVPTASREGTPSWPCGPRPALLCAPAGPRGLRF